MDGLNDKQIRFVHAMLVEPNATQAYIAAGYKSRGPAAEATASRLLRNHKVAVALTKLREERAERVEVDQDWVLEKLVANVDRSMKVEPVYNKEGDEIGEYQYQGSVANKALELVGKHLGMFTEKVEHTGKDGGPIEQEMKIVADERKQRFDALFNQLNAYRAGHDDGSGESDRDERIHPADANNQAASVSSEA